jgi:hypothetical protein
MLHRDRGLTTNQCDRVHALQLATMVKDHALAATKLLAKAPGILKEVDDAVIFKNHPAREIPSFEPNGA